MTRRKPRWELVTTDVGHHVRFRASNGRIVVSSEVYRRRVNAIRAIEVVAERQVYGVGDGLFVTTHHGVREVREVDER